MIIVLVTIVAIGVIMTVILASVWGSTERKHGGSSDSGGSVSASEPSDSDYNSFFDSNGSNSGEPSSEPPISSDPSMGEVDGIIATANSLIGVPFAENGADPDGFDNSGFIYYVLRENGFITCPRTIEGQAKMGAVLKYNELKAGDLAFFSNDDGATAGFGGIYIGGGKMIACLVPGTNVMEVDITTNYYGMRFFCGISLS